MILSIIGCAALVLFGFHIAVDSQVKLPARLAGALFIATGSVVGSWMVAIERAAEFCK